MILACMNCSHSAAEHETGEEYINDIDAKVTFGHCQSPDCECTSLHQSIGLNPADKRGTFPVEVGYVIVQRGNRFTEPVGIEINGKEISVDSSKQPLSPVLE